MINSIIIHFKNLDKLTFSIMKKGLYISLVLAIISAFFLFTYTINTSLSIFYIGLSLLKLSLYLSVEFIICGLVMNSIIKEL